MTMMKTLRFHAYGEPADVLQLETAAIPQPGAGAIRVRVHACGLNPADWALCRGLFAHELPRGIGLDVSGTVDALGEGITGIEIGDAVLGPANYTDHGSAGASDYAVLNHWAPVPPDLGMVDAAALTMAIETAYRYIDWLGVAKGQTVVINGGGAVIGYAAVQMALMRGARVIAIAGATFAEKLRGMGAEVTAYGDGMVERVRAIIGGVPDLILDAAPINLLRLPSVLPDLVEIAGGDPRRVMTCGDFANAAALGVRTGHDESGGMEGLVLRYDVLGQFAQLAAEGRFSVPVSRRFALEDWREALDLSLSGRAHGKLVLMLSAAAEAARSP